MDELVEKYKGTAKEISRMDGVSCEFGNWRFNVRPSNTEPLLRLNMEADSEQLMNKKKEELLEFIRS